MPPWIHFSALLSSESTNFNYTTKYFIDKVTNSRRQTRDMHAWFLTLTIQPFLFTYSLIQLSSPTNNQWNNISNGSLVRVLLMIIITISHKNLYTKENSFNFNKKKKKCKNFYLSHISIIFSFFEYNFTFLWNTYDKEWIFHIFNFVLFLSVIIIRFKK